MHTLHTHPQRHKPTCPHRHGAHTARGCFPRKRRRVLRVSDFRGGDRLWDACPHDTSLLAEPAYGWDLKAGQPQGLLVLRKEQRTGRTTWDRPRGSGEEGPAQLDRKAWGRHDPHPHPGPAGGHAADSSRNTVRALSLPETVLGFSLPLTCACGSAQNKGFAALLLTTRPAVLTAAAVALGTA